MSHSNLMTRAKQGDVEAIAALLTHALQQHRVTVRGRAENGHLQLLLEFPEPLDQAFAIALIQQGMQRLEPQGIHHVKASGRLLGSTKFAWSFFFTLEATDSQQTQETTVTHKPEPIQVANLTPSPSSLQKGDPSLSIHPTLIDSTGWGALITGLILGSLLFTIPLLKIIFRGFIVMVHEVGHAVTHWAFGRPAFPTVNLLYGGGITLHFGQVPLLIGLIYAGIGWLFYWQRSHPRRLITLGIGTLLYSYCLLTSTNEMLSVFMGHGMELAAIAVCLFLSASGYFCRFTGDRTIYAMLGFFTLFNNVEFAWQLNHDSDVRAWYEGGIGGAIDNDFVILANEYWHVDLSFIANTFLLICLLTPVIAAITLFFIQRLFSRLKNNPIN